jgi:hypothetical protein
MIPMSTKDKQKKNGLKVGIMTHQVFISLFLTLSKVVAEGTQMDIIVGFLIGFFAGILVTFWITESSIFTKRQQMGKL